MKFRMIHLGYRQTPDYPYDYRIELVEYGLEEREQLGLWLQDLKIPHITAGWNTGSVIYMRAKDASHFALRWS
jgi:hypothetical protein